MKILIADDSKLLRDKISLLLSDIKRISLISKASNTIEALELFEKIKHGIIIADIQMPGNGFELIKNIREISQTTKIIVFSNYPEEEYRKKAEECGADYFFVKGIDIDKLFETVEKIAGKI